MEDVLQNWPGLFKNVSVRKDRTKPKQTKGSETVSNEKWLKKQDRGMQCVILDSIPDPWGKKKPVTNTMIGRIGGFLVCIIY